MQNGVQRESSRMNNTAMAAKGIFVDDEDKQFAIHLSTRGVLEF